MSAFLTHLELAPPPAKGLARSLSLSVAVHLLLLMALTWGIRWQHTDSTPAVEAELWSALPKVAAPPPPPPAPEPVAEPPPPPAPKVKPTPPAPSRDADIAIAKQKKAEQDKKLEQEQLKLKKQIEQKEKALEQQRQRDKLAQEQREKKELALKEQKDKERKEKERKEQEAKRAAQDERKLQAMRDENMRRMAGMAGATGSPNASGDALRSSGPSASYGGRIIARVKPNIVFNPDDVSGNPVAEVEVRTASDGKIMARKLIKSSGNKAWDDAVLKALDKTDSLPRDTDGTIPNLMVLGFRPRD